MRETPQLVLEATLILRAGEECDHSVSIRSSPSCPGEASADQRVLPVPDGPEKAHVLRACRKSSCLRRSITCFLIERRKMTVAGGDLGG